MKKMLLIGIGNSGRGDDGLGWRLAEKAEELFHDICDVEYRYQLQVEDAELVSHYDTVIFADASHNESQKGFSFAKCIPARQYFFSSHIQSPEAVLYLADVVFAKSMTSLILAITGKEWELKTSMSEAAERNLEAAFGFLKLWMEKRFLERTECVTDVVVA